MQQFSNHLATKGWLVLAGIVSADFLFYGQPLGINLAIYASYILILLGFGTPQALKQRAGRIVWFALAGLVFAIAYDPDLLNTLLFGLGSILFMTTGKQQEISHPEEIIRNALRFIRVMMNRPGADSKLINKINSRRLRSGSENSLRYYALPLMLASLFLFMFAGANPLLGDFLFTFNLSTIAALLRPSRIIFWIILAMTLWAMLRPHFKPVGQKGDVARNLEHWINLKSLVFSLILFNGIFLIQNGLDLAFLWSGSTLPEGMSYARYAQDGAYPLLITVIVAAIYIDIVFNEQQKKLHSPLARKLVILWLVQNLFMVASAAIRLGLYVEAYSLTYLRLASFIWMGLIAGGLLLVGIRLVMNYSNNWLIKANSLMLAIVLYACCFVNFGEIIAGYNISEPVITRMAEQKRKPDLLYIYSLGHSALPALQNYVSHTPGIAADMHASLQSRKLSLRTEMTRNWRNITLYRALLAMNYPPATP